MVPERKGQTSGSQGLDTEVPVFPGGTDTEGAGTGGSRMGDRVVGLETRLSQDFMPKDWVN